MIYRRKRAARILFNTAIGYGLFFKFLFLISETNQYLLEATRIILTGLTVIITHCTLIVIQSSDIKC